MNFLTTPGRIIRGQAPSHMGHEVVRNSEPVKLNSLSHEAHKPQHLALPESRCLSVKRRKELKNESLEHGHLVSTASLKLRGRESARNGKLGGGVGGARMGGVNRPELEARAGVVAQAGDAPFFDAFIRVLLRQRLDSPPSHAWRFSHCSEAPLASNPHNYEKPGEGCSESPKTS